MPLYKREQNLDGRGCSTSGAGPWRKTKNGIFRDSGKRGERGFEGRSYGNLRRADLPNGAVDLKDQSGSGQRKLPDQKEEWEKKVANKLARSIRRLNSPTTAGTAKKKNLLEGT